MTRERPDHELVTVLADEGELVEVVDVDEELGRGEPELHHRQQAVAAGDDARAAAYAAKRRNRPVQARRSLVLKPAGRLHWRSPPCVRRSARTEPVRRCR